MNEADRYLQERLEQQTQMNSVPVSGVQRRVTMGEAWMKFWTTWTSQGRASRSEYWFMVLWNCLISFAIGALSAVPELGGVMSVVGCLCFFAYLIPVFFLCVRRLHDIGRSDWWLLILLVPVVGYLHFFLLMTTASEPKSNQYGPVPNLEGAKGTHHE